MGLGLGLGSRLGLGLWLGSGSSGMWRASRCDSFSGSSSPLVRVPRARAPLPAAATGTSTLPPPSTGRTVTLFALRCMTYAGTQPPCSSLGSHTQSELSTASSSGVCSSTGFSQRTSSVTMLW